MNNVKCALVLGSSGGIGAAMVSEFLCDPDIAQVFAVSRLEQPTAINDASVAEKLTWLQSDYSEVSMTDVADILKSRCGSFAKVCICHGVLHSESLWPEKRLDDLNEDNLHRIFQSNTVVPAIWLKVLFKVLKGDTDCVVAALSARVGSIGDNKLGGWYGYRASKASLNMILKTASVEYARRAKNVKFISFHPGTTDTELSKPFQSAVAASNLFSPEFVAEKLSAIMDSVPIDGELSFLDWNGKEIDW